MSTNKTTNYQLHSWEAGDDFLRTEFNENFNILDAKGVKVVTGTYIGDDVSGHLISLPWTPIVVLVLSRDGGTMYHALANSDSQNNRLRLAEGGFTVSSYLNWPNRNTGNADGAKFNPYNYVAFCWEE